MIAICGSGKRLAYSKRKYGIENHVKEILEFCEDRDSLYKREAELVNEQTLADPMNINLKLGGEGGWEYVNSLSSFDSKSKAGIKGAEIRLSRRKNDVNVLKSFENKIRNIQLDKAKNGEHPWQKKPQKHWIGKKHSDESKQKISIASSLHQSGAGNSQYGTCWVYSTELQQCQKINRNDLEMFLEQGWIKGRKMKF